MTGEPSKHSRPPNYLRADVLVLLLGFALVAVTVYSPLEALLQRWLRFDEAYSHGLFVFGVSLFLIYRALRYQRFGLSPSLVGILLAGVTAVAIALADVVNILILQQMGAVFLWWSIVVALLGWRAGFRLAVPIGFLYYAVPMWDYLTKLLVNLAVVVNDLLLGLRGIHFQAEGVYIHLLDVGTFEIADGCSGLRYLVVALTLSTLFSALNFSRVRHWIALHAVAILMALAVNWIRIFVIILAGYETEMQSSLVNQHEMFGWIVFAIALVPFFFFANRLAYRSDAFRETAVAEPDGNAPRTMSGVAVAAIVIAVVAPGALLNAPVDIESAERLEHPSRLGHFDRSSRTSDTLWSPEMRRADQVLRAVYESDTDNGRTVDLGIWYYAHQRQGHELIQFGNRVIDGSEWRVRAQARHPGGIAGWTLVDLDHRYLQQRRVVAYSHFVSGEWIASGGLPVKREMLRRAFSGRRDGALVTLSAACDSDEGCAEEAKALFGILDDGRPTELSAIFFR